MSENNNTSIGSLVASKVKTEEVATESKNEQRFMLVLTEKTRNDLRDLCEKINVKQISFASELFTVALQDAIKAFNATQSKTATPPVPASK